MPSELSGLSPTPTLASGSSWLSSAAVQPARWDQPLPPLPCPAAEPAHGAQSEDESPGDQVAVPLPLLADWDLPMESGTLVCFSLLPRSVGT